MRRYTIVFLFLLISIQLFSNNQHRFFIQGRSGVTVKIDPKSALTPIRPEKKGPTLEEIPREMNSSEFEALYLDKVTDKADRAFVEGAYQLDLSTDTYKLRSDFLPTKIYASIIDKSTGNNLIREQKRILAEYYAYDFKTKTYRLRKEGDAYEIIPIILRIIFLWYNDDNLTPSDFLQPGAPSPHNFPRVFNARTKANFDLSFSWGVRFDNNVTLGFAFMLTNFVMPSLEIMVKYNFPFQNLPIEPYVGGVLYGGFIDGFPIGLNALGGVDYYPLFSDAHRKGHNSISGEARVGAVIYTNRYYDTGRDDEGIWKEFQILAEGGLYLMTGYIFD